MDGQISTEHAAIIYRATEHAANYLTRLRARMEELSLIEDPLYQHVCDSQERLTTLREELNRRTLGPWLMGLHSRSE